VDTECEVGIRVKVPSPCGQPGQVRGDVLDGCHDVDPGSDATSDIAGIPPEQGTRASAPRIVSRG